MRGISRFHPYMFILCLAGLLALAGCGQDAAQQQQAAPQVGVITLKPQRVPLTTELTGRTSAYLEAEVRPQVGGIILKRLFTEGSMVKEGQVLYEIDPAVYQAAYENAKANLDRTQANLSSARLLAQRYEEVVKVNAVSKQQYNDAVAAYGQARADVAAAKAALESARINLDYTKVTAPVSGHIGKSSVTPGALVTASQAQSLALIQQLNPMYVDVTQSSADILRLRRSLAEGRLERAGDMGAKVTLILEDGSQYNQPGELQFSDVTVDPTTGVVTLRAIFPNPQNLLYPGMYVRAMLQEAVNDNAILAPQQGVTRDTQGRPTAMVVKADGTVESRVLTVDRSINLNVVDSRLQGTAWLVSSGLEAGDKLIIEGLQKVRNGAKATAVEVSPMGVSVSGQQGTAPAQGVPAAGQAN